MRFNEICFGIAVLNRIATLISSLLQTEQFRIVRGLQGKKEPQGPQRSEGYKRSKGYKEYKGSNGSNRSNGSKLSLRGPMGPRG